MTDFSTGVLVMSLDQIEELSDGMEEILEESMESVSIPVGFFTYLDAFCKPDHFQEYLPDYVGLDELKEHYQRGGLSSPVLSYSL